MPTQRECSVDRCLARVMARGWCSKHYNRWLTKGSLDDPLPHGSDWPEGHRACSHCKAIKPFEDFSPAKKGRTGRASWCRTCVGAQTKRWQKAGKYGLEPGEFERLVEAQGGRCGICRKEQIAPYSRLCIDHDHETGKVRGLLCHPCNLGLGKLGDTVEAMERVLAYLKGKGANENDTLEDAA